MTSYSRLVVTVIQSRLVFEILTMLMFFDVKDDLVTSVGHTLTLTTGFDFQ